ncbi:MAG: CPBP family intramembrane glutamic endopeptidase [Pseudomonadota bacterium]
MHLIDHLFIVLLFFVQPVYGWLSFRKLVAAARAGEHIDRLALYRETTWIEWLALLVLFASWAWLARDFSQLGLSVPGGAAFWWLLLACCGALALLAVSVNRMRTLDADERQRYARQIGDIGLFLPINRRELRRFYGVSITAGIVEEIIFRGFVLWYLGTFMPVWAAIVLSSLAFGLAHSYQGIQGIGRTAAVGAGLGMLYVVSGSIWLPIAVHALFDMIQGAQARELLRDRDLPTPETV